MNYVMNNIEYDGSMHDNSDYTAYINDALYVKGNSRSEDYHSNNTNYNTMPSPTYFTTNGWVAPLVSDYDRLQRYPHRPLTKQVDHVAYELPRAHQYAVTHSSFFEPFHRRYRTANAPVSTTTRQSGVAPQFLKVFGDVYESVGARIMLDCVLLGMPRPRVVWLFDGKRIEFSDVQVEDTADLCRLTIPHLQLHHYGTYTVAAENEAGRALTSANISVVH